MTDFDSKLRDALDADDEAFLQKLETERGLFTQIGDTFAGPLGGLSKLVFVFLFPMSAFMFYAVWQMFIAEGQRELILWGFGAMASIFAVGLIKQWFYDRMNLTAVLRELKRIELRIAKIEER